MRVTSELETIILHLAGQEQRSTAAIAAAFDLSPTTVRRIIVRRRREVSAPRDGQERPEPRRMS
jgi:DNA-directed RNA polymerase specialized sigma24 family protein